MPGRTTPLVAGSKGSVEDDKFYTTQLPGLDKKTWDAWTPMVTATFSAPMDFITSVNWDWAYAPSLGSTPAAAFIPGR